MTSPAARCWAVVPAAGTGSRMGADIPKQYLTVAGVTLLEHSLRALLGCGDISAVCVALHRDDTRAANLPVFDEAGIVTTEGAAQRSGSVLAGLLALEGRAEEHDWVLVHDAARPCLRPGDITSLVGAVRASGVGGLLAEPVVDTVKESDDEGRVVRTVDRRRLWRAQTPQMFRLGELRGALEQAHAAALAVTDEASAMEYAGYPVQLVAAGRHNLKVTVADDLPLAQWYLEQGAAEGGAG